MVYLVASLGDSTAQKNIGDKLMGSEHTFHRVENLFFVSFDGTTSELNEKLGFGDDVNVDMGIVLPVTTYAGYAYKNIWEWIKVYDKT